MDDLWFQWTVAIVGSVWAVGGLISALARKNIRLEHEALKERFEGFLKSEFKPLVDHVGKHFSDIGDLQMDFSRIETKVENHKDKFLEINIKIDELRDEVKDGLKSIVEKIDLIRDRRKR